jgi:anti-sigma factor RsiW
MPVKSAVGELRYTPAHVTLDARGATMHQPGASRSPTRMESTPLNPADEMACNEMACRELVEVVTDYLDGTLPDEDRRRLEDHLAECPYCITYIEQMRETIEALGTVSEESISAETRQHLLEAFRGWRDR